MPRKKARYILLTENDVIGPEDEIWDDVWKWRRAWEPLIGQKLKEAYKCGEEWRTHPVRRRFDVIGLGKTRVLVWVGSSESSRMFDVDPDKGLNREKALFLTRKAVIEGGEKSLLGFIGKEPKVLDPFISGEELLYLMSLHNRLKDGRTKKEEE